MLTNTLTSEAKPTVAAFKAWTRANHSLAYAVVAAQALAKVERERVDAYIAPVFARFTFTDSRTGEPITTPKDLYRSTDEEECAAFYAACDAAHRERGFTGEPGHCPALVAEHNATQAERALLDSLGAFLGQDLSYVYGDMRKKALDLALGSCINAR